MTLEDLQTLGNAGVISLASPDPRVAVYWAPRGADPAAAARFETVLAPAERERAGRFGRDELRQRYIVGRSTLRVVLGATLGVPAAEVAIVRGRRGRPELAGRSVDFNVTHTGEVMLLAVARGVVVGVDVEHRDRTINADGIARRCLTDDERARLDDGDADARRRQVLRLWTCKEAMSKATGDALAAPFRELDVLLEPHLRLTRGPGHYDPPRWTLHALQAPAGYLATLALWSR